MAIDRLPFWCFAPFSRPGAELLGRARARILQACRPRRHPGAFGPAAALEDSAGIPILQLEFVMQPSLPLWLQPLPPELRRRLELAEATAREARLDTHAQQALHLVAVLATRMPFDEAVERYIDIMGLMGEEAETVHTRTLVALGDTALGTDLSKERHRTGWGLDWRYATPLGAVRFVRRKMRRGAEEDLWMELSAARAEEALIRSHMKHAMAFVKILQDFAPPTRAVSLYLDQLEIPAARARTVYQRVLARVADSELPRIVQDASPGPAPTPPRRQGSSRRP